MEGRVVEEINLPAVHTQGIGSLFESGGTNWFDFSKLAEGIIVINLTPPLGGVVEDEREWEGKEYSAQFRHTAWGTGAAVSKGQTKIAKVAMFIHGQGGYQGNIEIINLLVDLGKSEAGALKASESYKDSGAKGLAFQALAVAESAFDKIVVGNVAGAKDDLTKASSLLMRAEEAEKLALFMNDLMFITAIFVAVAVIVVLMIRRRGKK